MWMQKNWNDAKKKYMVLRYAIPSYPQTPPLHKGNPGPPSKQGGVGRSPKG